MRKQIWVMSLLLSGAAFPAFAGQLMAGMGRQEKTAQASSLGTNGKVLSVDRAETTVRLAHEPIKPLGWPAMTMDFKVKDAAMLDGLKTGDTVTFELGKGEDVKWLITRIAAQNAKPTVVR